MSSAWGRAKAALARSPLRRFYKSPPERLEQALRLLDRQDQYRELNWEVISRFLAERDGLTAGAPETPAHYEIALLRSALRLLSQDHPHSRACWDVLLRFLTAERDRFAEGIGRRTPEEQIVHLCSLFLIFAIRPGFETFERRTKLFDAAQAMGVHLLPVHFYSPVPDTSKLGDRVWRERFDEAPGWRLDAEKQLPLLRSLGAWTCELQDIPREARNPREYHWRAPANETGPENCTPSNPTRPSS